MPIENCNIRATALQEFWVNEYPDSLYLWQGAKHNCSLADIMESDSLTLDDLFSTQEKIQEGHDFCKGFYNLMLPELSWRLNKIHNVDFPVSFWRVVLGYWLYRHISITYDKYAYLSKINIDATGIKLLCQNDFYIPNNHVDYIFCFSGDFGVQQLVSQYYYLYKTKNFPIVNAKFANEDALRSNNSISMWFKHKLCMLRVEPQIALLGSYFSEGTKIILNDKSQGKINDFTLPSSDIIKNAEVDYCKRSFVASTPIEKSYESYFYQSLYYCLPKDLIENFSGYCDVFIKDIDTRKFTHIVSEEWISNIPIALYIALARMSGIKFIASEHGSGSFFYKNFLHFIDYDACDIFLSVGWGKNENKFISGGFACRDIVPYQQDCKKSTILFVTRTKFLYWEEFNEYNATNSTFIKELMIVAAFIEKMPLVLKDNLRFRPRQADYFWDVERLLEIEKNNVKIDRGPFTDSISQSRIVVIDHISTGLAEILLQGVPFILIYDIKILPLPSELQKIFGELIDCGVLHLSADTAVSHLSLIYENTDDWWQSKSVRLSVEKLIEVSLAPACETTDFLLTLLSFDEKSRPVFRYHFGKFADVLVRRIYRVITKIKLSITQRIN